MKHRKIMGKKVVTLGEIMLRLSTLGNTRFVQSDSFDVVYGGGEANVAVSCANYGHDAYFVTKLPKHEIGQSAVNALRKYGVKTDFIARGGDRVGIYYLETGASMRPSKVIYDRAHSAIAEADAADSRHLRQGCRTDPPGMRGRQTSRCHRVGRPQFPQETLD